MKKLNEKEWQPKPVAVMFNKLIPGKSKGLNHLKQAETGINYIGATNRDNGVLCIVEDDETSSKMVQDGNCIGFIKNGDGSAGYAIYKQEPFISTSDVIYGYADWLDEDTGLFFVVAQDMIEAKYCHGYKRNKQHLRGDKVMLPVTDSGEPDYEYMAEYTKQTREKLLSRYREYVAKRIAELGEEVEIPALSEKEWKIFRVGDFFEVSRPIARNKDAYESGDIPFVASGSMNNGIMKYCTPHDGEYLDAANCVTVSPVDGSSFYQPIEFLGRGGAGSSILILRDSRLNKFNGQFIARLIQQTCSKYTYGHMGNKGSIKRERVMFPATDSGEPDYAYMEQYVKNMMLRKYRQYLAYLDRQKQRQE